MIGRCASSSAACPGKGISGRSCHLRTRSRPAGTTIAFAAAAEWEPRTAEEGFPLLAAGMTRDEGQALFAPFREKIFQLPPEVRRPHQFSALFAMIHAPAKLPEVLGVARSWRADAIVYDSCDLAAPIAAASLGLPSVNHSFGAMVPLAALEAARGYLEPLWRGEGLEPDPYAGAFRGLFVDLAPPSFAWEQPRGEVVRLRPVPDTAEAPPAWLDELEQPLVYVTMGTVYNQPELFRPLLDGLDGVAALVTVGRNVEPDALGAVAAARPGGAVRAAGAHPPAQRRRSSRTAARGRRSARSRTGCRSCWYPRPPTSSTTPPAPRRPARPSSCGRAR